jgi:hypothetical protein
VGCGDGWDLEDLNNWINANIFAISATHQHPNPENPQILKILILMVGVGEQFSHPSHPINTSIL